MDVTLPRHYRGPLTSANGGYTCGRLASFVDADEVEVTLRLPPPLDRPLAIEREEESVLLLDGDQLVAEARPSALDIEPPPSVSLAEADAARERHVRGFSPGFAECYVCGLRADGLQVHVGPVLGREPLHAAPVVLPDALPELVWAAIDCPGAYAVADEGRGDVVLGRMTARVDRVPDAGEECVVTSWPLGDDGRKLCAGTALFAADGALLAVGKQIWIVPRAQGEASLARRRQRGVKASRRPPSSS